MGGGNLELRDIHLPEAVSWWPPAPGWWILAICVLVAVVYLARGYARTRPRRRAVREALTEFRRICECYHKQGDAAHLLAQLSVLLRRVAVTLRPRGSVAGLTGQAWLAELDRCLGGNGFRKGPGRLLADAPYRPQVPKRNMEMLMELCAQWLRAQGKFTRARNT